MSKEQQKKAAAAKALDFIKSDTIVGLGSGTTAHFFIQLLIEQVQKGLSITAVSSSKESENLAKKGGIRIQDINEVPYIDITVDGADEIDAKKRMIKGGGGAHVREKILANYSQELIIIVDASKYVEYLGKRSLPVEVLPFGYKTVEKAIHSLKLTGDFRKQNDQLYITDNGNYIYDVKIAYPCLNPEHVHDLLIHIPGVVDTGFFFNLAKKVIIASSESEVKVL